ncbi:helix-turn-helix transcriptional regulator [Lactobacillus apis]|uniref:helix-turn-helix transcriptional regulator n=1 Tax=Lactobacillus apis TaxID=303541 RepID=UPI0024314644|nr:helix-turn-helix transcriptional regulator [Lactobacillus apis]
MNNRIKELREEKGLTLEKLGEKVDIAKNTLSRYESGNREPKLKVWQKLADYFNVSVPYLQGFNEHKPNRLKELRNKKGMSQSQFVQAFNELLISKKMKPITIPTYSRWENSLNSPTDKVWQQLADYLEVSVSYIKGEIDTEYLGKIIKTIYLVACNKKILIKTKKESIITEIDRTIAITELLLLMFKQLNLDHRSESREIFEKNASLLGLVGDEKVDYIKEVSVSATEENYKYGIECAKALIDFYDSL